MQRREYITAIAVVLGVSGCVESDDSTQTPTYDEAMNTFTDITEFEAPMEQIEGAARFVDEDAEIVFYGFYHQVAATNSGSQFEVVSKPLADTDLTPGDTY